MAEVEEVGDGGPVIPCSWADLDGATLKVENDYFEVHGEQCVVVDAIDSGDAVVVCLTPTQAREMASALIVYAFFVDRTNAARAEADDG